MNASCCPKCDSHLAQSEAADACESWCKKLPLGLPGREKTGKQPVASAPDLKGTFGEVFRPLFLLLALVVLIFVALAADSRASAGLAKMAALVVLADCALAFAALVQRLTPVQELPAQAEPVVEGGPVVSVQSMEEAMPAEGFLRTCTAQSDEASTVGCLETTAPFTSQAA